ncbi:hypothetical protein Ancab_031899 [Ancistrocladus abbreviatus]
MPGKIWSSKPGKWPNEEQDEAILDGKEGESNKLDAVAQSPSKNTATPVNSYSSPAEKHSTGSKPDQLSSRWSSREDREGPILEIYDRHKSPESRRYHGNETSSEARDKRENNISALIAGQQSGDGDLSEGQGLRDEWETPISSLKREKGRTNKSKRASEFHTVDFTED